MYHLLYYKIQNVTIGLFFKADSLNAWGKNLTALSSFASRLFTFTVKECGALPIYAIPGNIHDSGVLRTRDSQTRDLHVVIGEYLKAHGRSPESIR